MKDFFIDLGPGKPEFYQRGDNDKDAFIKCVTKYLESLEISGRVTDLDNSSSSDLNSKISMQKSGEVVVIVGE